MSNRWDLIRVSLARRFFMASVCQGGLILAVAAGLAFVFGRQESSDHIRLPPVFLLSTGLLALGSWYIESAHTFVRRERQREFRAALLRAQLLAMLFVTLQGFGLWAMDKGIRTPADAQIGVRGFIIMLTTLHAMHFIVAQSVLLWVTLSACADRYDHEYYLGVTFARWFWHVLGIVWLGILFVFSMALISRG